MAIKIHIYLFLMMAYMFAIGKLEVFFVYYIFAIMHEIAHMLVSLLLKVDVCEITLLPTGVNAKYEWNVSALKEFFISLAGPLASFLFYIILENKTLASFNLIICLTNLIPIIPFDGGKIIRAILIMSFGKKVSRKIMCFITQSLLIFLIVISALLMVMNNNYYFCILTFYIYCIAKEELEKEKFYGLIDYLQN